MGEVILTMKLGDDCLKRLMRLLCALCAVCVLASGAALAEEGCGIGDAAFAEFTPAAAETAPAANVQPAVVQRQSEEGLQTAPAATENPLATESSTKGFVYRMYKVVLGREPDQAGFDSWVASLDSGKNTAADLVFMFFNSDEYTAKGKNATEIITDCYRTMLNREPDQAGLNAWKVALDVGMSSDVVCAGFAASDEFTALAKKYGITPGTLKLTKARDQNYERTAFVYRLYRDCLQRAPELAGLENWCLALSLGAEGTSVASGFIFSTEYKDKLPGNDEFIEMLYRTILGRNADKAGMSGWVDLLNYTATREKILNGFMFSPEFAAKCRTAGINLGNKINEPDTTPAWQANILVLSLVNAERAKYGEAPLITREDLWERVAMVRAQEVSVLFSHTRPNGSPFYTAYDEAGFSNLYLAGENIAFGYRSEQAVVTAWMNSEGHRENILRESFEILATGLYGGSNWSQNFLTLPKK